MLRQLRTRRHLASALSLLTLLALASASLARGRGHHLIGEASGASRVAPRRAPPGEEGRVIARVAEAATARAADGRARVPLRWSEVRLDGDGFVERTADGRRVELTLDPRLQRLADHVLAEHGAPYASAVLLSVDDGRVLALAGRAEAAARRDAARAGRGIGEASAASINLALRPWAPAASVFKLVTAAALVEAGVAADARVCYHDGVHSVEASNLESHPRLDGACGSFAFGLAKSQNAIIARLAHDHLDPDALERTARALGFGAPLPFELPVAPSEVAVPRGDSLGFARVAAGFWSTTLSPLHGAVLAATIARAGVVPPVRIVDRVVDRDGNAARPAAAPERRAISAEAARAVGRMMVGTTEFGTARLGFHDRRGRPLLPGIAVAGKTGSLNREQPFLAYSWFVGYAPAERPEIAVAVLLGNGADWKVKAHQVAAELLSGYFNGAQSPTRVASR
jgi:cell division protein FtsI/penicillin-binding protein 2